MHLNLRSGVFVRSNLNMLPKRLVSISITNSVSRVVGPVFDLATSSFNRHVNHDSSPLSNGMNPLMSSRRSLFAPLKTERHRPYTICSLHFGRCESKHTGRRPIINGVYHPSDLKMAAKAGNLNSQSWEWDICIHSRNCVQISSRSTLGGGTRRDETGVFRIRMVVRYHYFKLAALRVRKTQILNTSAFISLRKCRSSQSLGWDQVTRQSAEAAKSSTFTMIFHDFHLGTMNQVSMIRWTGYSLELGSSEVHCIHCLYNIQLIPGRLRTAPLYQAIQADDTCLFCKMQFTSSSWPTLGEWETDNCPFTPLLLSRTSGAAVLNARYKFRLGPQVLDQFCPTSATSIGLVSLVCVFWNHSQPLTHSGLKLVSKCSL